MENGARPGEGPIHAKVTFAYAGRPPGHDWRPLAITLMRALCDFPWAQFGVQSVNWPVPVADLVLAPQLVHCRPWAKKLPSPQAKITWDGLTCSFPEQSGNAITGAAGA
jgi:hypothetical protein